MTYNSEINEHYRKSVLTTVEDVGQFINDADETSLMLGQPVYKSGTAIEANDTWHEIKRRGLYRVEGSIVFMPSEHGEIVVRILLDGKALPASRLRLSAKPGQYIAVTPCAPAFDRSMSPALNPKLELTIAGVPGFVVRTMLSTTKLA